MIINFGIKGDKEVIAHFKSMPADVHTALLKKVTFLSISLELYIKNNKLNGQVLKRRSGDLAASITHAVVDNGMKVIGRVFSSGDVKYAAVHEYGGKGPYVIFANKAKVLAFMWNGVKVFRRSVTHPPAAERSFMRSALADKSAEYSLDLKTTIVKAMQAGAA